MRPNYQNKSLRPNGYSLIEVKDVVDQLTGDYVNDATLTANLVQNGETLATTNLEYVAESNGVYRGSVLLEDAEDCTDVEVVILNNDVEIARSTYVISQRS